MEDAACKAGKVEYAVGALKVAQQVKTAAYNIQDGTRNHKGTAPGKNCRHYNNSCKEYKDRKFLYLGAKNGIKDCHKTVKRPGYGSKGRQRTAA